MSGEDQVCIAFAGSGKTGTGVEVAHRLGKFGLAMMFNRAARNDMNPRLPAGMDALTFHALGYRKVIEPSQGFTAKLAGELNPDDGPRLSGPIVARELGLSASSDPDISSVSQLAMAIMKTVENFQISAANKAGPEHVPDEALPLSIRQPENAAEADELRERLADWAGKLWTLMVRERNNFPINHDTYLKIFQLRREAISADLWILDEYQDTAPVAEALIRQQSGQKLYLGDPYQQIYGFRNAINALNEPISRGVPVHYLTDSFRYNHQIAGLATLVLRALGEMNSVRGQGRELLPANLNAGHTVICRSNLTILVRAGDAILNQRSIRIEGGLPQNTFARVESALALFEDRIEDVKVGAMRSMGSWQSLKDQVAGIGDRAGDASALIQLVERYRGRLPLLLTAVREAMGKRPRTPDTIHYITAHKSKGREFPMVALDDDLSPSPDLMGKLRSDTPLNRAEIETLNILYVALTRAELSIYLPTGLKHTFAQLNDLFGSPGSGTNDHLAETQVGIPAVHAAIVRKARTEAFIKAHRNPDRPRGKD